MGTDIFIYVEVHRHGRWLLAEPLEKNPIWDGEPSEMGNEWKPRELFSDRVYELFAILANVRNPMRAVTPFEYIAEPRGLPSDASRPLREWHNCWKDDAFAESWLLVAELLAFDWHGKEITRRGQVDAAAAHLFPPGRRGFPLAEWPAGLAITVADQSRAGVEVRWTETYAEAVGTEFMTTTLDTLRSYGDSKDVRVVFWFDG